MQKSPIHRQKKTRYPSKLKTWLLPLTVVLTLAACGSPEKSGGDKAKLSVGAATSLKPVMVELAADFKNQSGINLSTSFASSGALFAQVSLSAPFEVFLSADSTRPEALFKAGLSTEPVNYARGKLLLASTKAPVCELLSSANPTLSAIPSLNTLAMANPVVAPYGLAAKEALIAAFPGRFDGRLALVQPPKDVPISSFDAAPATSTDRANPTQQSNAALGASDTETERNNPDLPPPGQSEKTPETDEITEPTNSTADLAPVSQSSAELTQPTLLTAQNAAQTFGLIVSKNADAGLIASSDWSLYTQTEGSDGCAFEVDPSLYAPINHALTLIPASEPSAAAKQFAAYLQSDRAQAILKRYGFSSP